MYYTAPLYLGPGPSLTRFDLLYDTGSPEVTLGVNTCTGCKGKKYDPSAGIAAGTFEWTTDSRTITYYDGTQYTGRRCKERTCPINNASTCMTKF